MGTEGRQPHRRRLPDARILVAGALGLAAIAVILVLLLDTGSGQSLLPSTPISNASLITAGEPGFRFVLSATITIGRRRIDTVTDGAVAQRPSLDASLVTHSAGTSVATVLVYPYEYVQSRTAGRTWERIDLRAVEDSLSVSGSTGAANPADLIDLLRAAGTVTRVGSATVRRVATTRYHAVIELDRYRASVPAAQRAAAGAAVAQLERLTGSKTLPIDVWIDARERVRRLALSVSARCAKLGQLRESITMDVFDYAFQAPVAAPPPHEVTDITREVVASAAADRRTYGCR
jgi:hypothetical protein